MESIEIRYGQLHNVYGFPAEMNGFRFVPAVVGLDGNGFDSRFPLREHVTDTLRRDAQDAQLELPFVTPAEIPGREINRAPAVLLAPIKRDFDAAWVRGRIPRVFGFTPGPAGAEKALLHEGFLAVVPDRRVAYPFICTDYYGKTSLMFSPYGPEESTQRTIARSFWDLLLRDPEDWRILPPASYTWAAGSGWSSAARTGSRSIGKSKKLEAEHLGRAKSAGRGVSGFLSA